MPRDFINFLENFSCKGVIPLQLYKQARNEPSLNQTIMNRIDIIKKIVAQKQAAKATKNYLKIKVETRREEAFICQNPKLEWAKLA